MANEKRVRSDGVAGALSSGIAIAATSMSSAGLADLPVVDTTNHAALTLFQTDANGRITKREVVYVTAHTAAATTATIVKAQESTTDQAWSTGDKWVLAPTQRDYIKTNGVSWTGGPNSGGVNIVSTTWVDFGSATDLVVAAQAGDQIELAVNALSNNAAVSLYMTAVTVVGGSYINSIGGGGTANDSTGSGISGWGNSSSNWLQLTGSVLYQVASGDLSSGKVTFRVRTRVSAATTKFVYAGSGSIPYIFNVKNLGPAQS